MATTKPNAGGSTPFPLHKLASASLYRGQWSLVCSCSQEPLLVSALSVVGSALDLRSETGGDIDMTALSINFSLLV